ncbi:GNAT family N-acetyltransferase [Enterobacter soli]|uniref:GNAT family protein n=1 Tax=Enterobacter soli TaxID=885040 RepID=A0AAW8HE36_9ENTR|nr:GNAT family protein [Enterobacter soli]MDD9246786.1 GNAT family protein [Enterobacter soli]MDQ2258668.1 GNAT family protein [Enterobacter soli]MDQ2338745.1 GNAT family protein [Enterobacter soli]MDR7941197.1 GNAT family protein [Enterobacter soli]HEE9789892.1 GNAT family N-acetyltransferase [Enterobacter soli]
MPALTTVRLTCSPLQESDWPFFLALQQHPDVMRFVAEDRSVADIREAFESRLAPWTPGSAHWLCLVVRDTASQTPLGVTGYIHREDDCAEVGFLFAPSAQGKGYGFESLQALCEFAFNQGGIRRLTATVTAGNIASRALLEKSGFRLEGELRESYFLSGRWQNDWLFGLLKHEFQA